MEIISYNAELAIANLQFKRIFSNIKIHRTDIKSGRDEFIPVTCSFEQRSRIMKNWENSSKRATYRLPLIIINRTGYSRNGDRVNNINNEVKYEITSKQRKYDLLTPVPIDITYDVTVMAKYPSDVDQIASNFMIFFNNDVFVKTMHPKYEGILMNNQVVMSDSVTEEHSGEIDNSQDDFVTSNFNFTFKTYLFGGTEKAQVSHKVLSSWLSSYVKTEEIEIKSDEIDEFQQQHPKQSVYALSSYQVTEQVTGYVESLSNETYDGFTPIINTLCIGFYPTPYLSDHVEYMTDVDSRPLSVQDYYVDRISWNIS